MTTRFRLLMIMMIAMMMITVMMMMLMLATVRTVVAAPLNGDVDPAQQGVPLVVAIRWRRRSWRGWR
jgi:hypothetical protein